MAGALRDFAGHLGRRCEDYYSAQNCSGDLSANVLGQLAVTPLIGVANKRLWDWKCMPLFNWAHTCIVEPLKILKS